MLSCIHASDDRRCCINVTDSCSELAFYSICLLSQAVSQNRACRTQRAHSMFCRRQVKLELQQAKAAAIEVHLSCIWSRPCSDKVPGSPVICSSILSIVCAGQASLWQASGQQPGRWQPCLLQHPSSTLSQVEIFLLHACPVLPAGSRPAPTSLILRCCRKEAAQPDSANSTPRSEKCQEPVVTLTVSRADSLSAR